MRESPKPPADNFDLFDSEIDANAFAKDLQRAGAVDVKITRYGVQWAVSSAALDNRAE